MPTNPSFFSRKQPQRSSLWRGVGMQRIQERSSVCQVTSWKRIGTYDALLIKGSKLRSQQEDQCLLSPGKREDQWMPPFPFSPLKRGSELYKHFVGNKSKSCVVRSDRAARGLQNHCLSEINLYLFTPLVKISVLLVS